MPIRLSYLDLLGYKAMEQDNPIEFHERFNAFVDFMTEEVEFYNIKTSQDSQNIDAFFVASDYDDNFFVFEWLCCVLCYKQITSILDYDFTLRGFMTYDGTFGDKDAFSEKNVMFPLRTYLDHEQKRTRFARVALDRDVANDDILKEALEKRILLRTNTRAKTPYINPFLPFFSLHGTPEEELLGLVEESFYRKLRDSVSKLLVDASEKDDEEPFRKAIWLALQFDYNLRRYNLPYEPILLTKSMKYAYVHIPMGHNSLDKYLEVCERIISAFEERGYDKKQIIRVLKHNNIDVSLRMLKSLSMKNSVNRIPIDSYKIIDFLIYYMRNEPSSSLYNASKITELKKEHDECYISLLEEIRSKVKYSFYGSLLEKARNEQEGIEKTRYFEFRIIE